MLQRAARAFPVVGNHLAGVFLDGPVRDQSERLRQHRTRGDVVHEKFKLLAPAPERPGRVLAPQRVMLDDRLRQRAIRFGHRLPRYDQRRGEHEAKHG